jgi:hypothetical protein
MAFGEDDSQRDEPKAAAPYLEAIEQYRKEFDRWFHRCDQIDRVYSGLQSLSGITLTETSIVDREYDLFWASMEIIKPSIYSRPPVPVVTTKFKDRKPVKRVTAELLERAAISGFETTNINASMIGVRDDLAINARGQLWVSYEDDGEEKVCIEDLDRDDFAHDPVRKWTEVSWVARRAWMTKKEMRDRFGEDAADDATYTEKRTEQARDSSTYGVKDTVNKAAVWEIWDKNENKVIWIADGLPDILEREEPHLKLKGFFPCPEPAYGTRQRRSLVPVPDMVYIQGQLETINLLTQKIHDLAELLRVIGIIPGGTDIGDAVETAIRSGDNSAIFVPVPAAAFGSSNKLVEWLPIDQVAQTILAAVEERRELIGNVQELLGVADIQRGDSDPNETLGAQQIKVQHTSTRSRDRVKGLERIARDAGRLMVEIFAEEFSIDTLLKMAQMELPTNAEIKRDIKEIETSAKAKIDEIEGGVLELAQQNPEKAQEAAQQAEQQTQQIIAEATEQVRKAASAVTVEQVKELLSDTKTDPFIFDIETDSTIYPDEMAEKQMRNEFLGALATGMQALLPMIQSGGAGAAGEILKWNLDVYRPPRALMSSIDEWIDTMANTPPQPNPDAAKNEAEAEYKKGMLAIEGQKLQQEGQYRMADIEIRKGDQQLKAQEIQQKPQTEAIKEQIKAEGNAQAKELDAQVAVAREEAQLGADIQTTQLSLDAEAVLEAQKQISEDAREAADLAFRREELAINTQLEYDKLDQQAVDAEAARQQAALKPSGGGNDR